MSSIFPNTEAVREALLAATYTQDFGPTDYSAEPAAPAGYGGAPHFHQGVDLVLKGGEGATIRTPASGVVEKASDTGNGYGNEILIREPNGFISLFGHLHDLNTLEDRDGHQIYPGRNLAVGDKVRIGDVIGHMGTTGNSSGPHLHYGVIDPNGKIVDPGMGPQNLWYTDYHDKGFGAGYLPGQWPDLIPDPTNPNQLPPVPITVIKGVDTIPSNPDSKDIRFPEDTQINGGPGGQPDPFCSAGQTAPTAADGTCPSGYVKVPVPLPTDPLHAICLCDSGTPSGGGGGFFDPQSLITDVVQGLQAGAVSLVLVGLAAVFIIAGVARLGKEKPVQSVINVTTPSVNAAKSGGRAVKRVGTFAKTVAKVGAAA